MDRLKIDEKYKLRDVAGEKVLLVQGTVGGAMSKAIAFNSTAELLWEAFRGREFTVEDACDRLIKEFDVAPEIALRDAQSWVEKLMDCGVIHLVS